MATGVANNQTQALGAQVQSLLNQLPAGTLGGGTTAANTTTPAATTATGEEGPKTLTGVNDKGVSMNVVKANNVYKLAAPTGKYETVQVDGRILRFNGKGENVRNFEIAAQSGIQIELDGRQGIAAGISNLSKVVAGRQERLKSLQEALARDVNESGSTNQLDIQRLVTEQQATEHLSNMNHKIYESVQNAISPWLR